MAIRTHTGMIIHTGIPMIIELDRPMFEVFPPSLAFPPPRRRQRLEIRHV